MLRSHCLAIVLIGTSLVLPPVSTTCAQDEDYSMTVVDLRDLNSALPRVDDSEHHNYMRQLLESFGSSGRLSAEDLRGLSSMSRQIADDGFNTPAALLVEQFQATGAFDLTSQQVMPGIFFFQGLTSDIEAMTSMLEQVHEMHSERVEIELACHIVVESNPPGIGAKFEGSRQPLMRTRQVMTRRVESPISVIERSAYVSDWQPVVGDQSVGYDPETQEAEYGLQAFVIVGRREDTESINVRLRGTMTDLYMQRLEGPSVDGTQLTLGLPRLSVRSLQSDISASIGQSTVAAVIPGFGPEESIVVTVRVRPISS